jgi:hypothetical protein
MFVEMLQLGGVTVNVLMIQDNAMATNSNLWMGLHV